MWGQRPCEDSGSSGSIKRHPNFLFLLRCTVPEIYLWLILCSTCLEFINLLHQGWNLSKVYHIHHCPCHHRYHLTNCKTLSELITCHHLTMYPLLWLPVAPRRKLEAVIMMLTSNSYLIDYVPFLSMFYESLTFALLPSWESGPLSAFSITQEPPSQLIFSVFNLALL